MSSTSAPLSKRMFPATVEILAFEIISPCWFLSNTGATVMPAALASNVDKLILVKGEKEEDLTDSCGRRTD